MEYKITAIGCTHLSHKNLYIPDSDILIHTGDALSTNTTESFFEWFSLLPAKHKFFVLGNHDDTITELGVNYKRVLSDSGIILLDNEIAQIDNAITVYGGTHTLPVFGWKDHPYSFNCTDEEEQKEVLAQIKQPIDIFITHGPAYQIRDMSGSDHIGSWSLRQHLYQNPPKVHFFSHVHYHYGEQLVSTWKESYFAYNVSIYNSYSLRQATTIYYNDL